MEPTSPPTPGYRTLAVLAAAPPATPPGPSWDNTALLLGGTTARGSGDTPAEPGCAVAPITLNARTIPTRPGQGPAHRGPGGVAGGAVRLTTDVRNLQVDLDPARLLDRIAAVGLRGRGGAAFPLAAKVRAVIAAAASSGRAPVVVANGEEGEPGSVKDRHLMRHRPELVLDGLFHAAAMVRAERAYVYVSDPIAAERMTAAIAVAAQDRRARTVGVDTVTGELAAETHGETHGESAAGVVPVEGVPVEVVLVEGAYVAGEETAVVRFIDGGPAWPVVKPPRPFERGVGGAPTLISNVETLAHVGLLARGVDSAGRRLVTVTGGGIAPALVEVSAGTRLRDVVAAIGAGPVRGALMGGMFGGLAGSEILDVPLDPDALRAAGSALGCGAVHLLSATDCPVDVAVDALAYLGEQSSRQCGVCVSGTRALADTAAKLRTATATADDLAKIERWAAALPGRGACGLLDAAARVAGSLLTAFPGAVAAHLDGPCPTCVTTEARAGARFAVIPAPILMGTP